MPELEWTADATSKASTRFEDVIAQFYDPIHRFFLRRTRDPERSADLAQITFLDAYRDWFAFPTERPIAPWLFRIAHNNLRSEQRRIATRRSVPLDGLVLNRERDGQGIAVITNRGADADSIESHERISRAFSMPSPNLRAALVLHAELGFTAFEVARRLGITTVAAERRISRAKRRFREFYCVEAPEDRGCA